MWLNATRAFAPVGLVLTGSGAPRLVRTLADAAYVLLKDWPDDDGEAYIIAVKSCVDAISGSKSASSVSRFQRRLQRQDLRPYPWFLTMPPEQWL